MSSATDALERKNELIRFARITRNMIRALATSLPLLFGWLKLQGVPLPNLGSDTIATGTLRGALVLYYFCWVWGVLLDTRDQETVLPFRPGKGRYPISAIFVAVAITAVFGLLCWIETHEEFAVALLGFWFVNLIAWRYLVGVLLKTTLSDAESVYRAERAYFAAARIRELDAYLNGRWQWWRFGIGTILILLLNVLLATESHVLLASRVPWLSPASLASLLILIFVIVVEVWAWFFRFRRLMALGVLDRLSVRHMLVERAPS